MIISKRIDKDELPRDAEVIGIHKVKVNDTVYNWASPNKPGGWSGWIRDDSQAEILPLDSLGIKESDLKPYSNPGREFQRAVRRNLKPRFWRDREALRKLAYMIFPEVKAATIEGLKQFVELAKDCETGKEFYDRARKIKDVPGDTAEWFYSRYHGRGLTLFDDCDEFIKDCKAGRIQTGEN